MGYLQALRKLAKYAHRKSNTIIKILSNKNELIDYIASNESISYTTHLKSILNILLRLGEREVGFKPIGIGSITSLENARKKALSNPKQHPPIPTRIYSKILAGIESELETWEKIETDYLHLLEEVLNNPLYGRNRRNQIAIARNNKIPRTPGIYYPEVDELITHYKLDNYLKAQNLELTIKGLHHGLTYIRTLAKVYIIAYSGMRSREASLLPFDCLTTDTDSTGKIHHIIRGRTTKTKCGETRWVTNAEGARAIRICQRIAKIIYYKFDQTPSTHNKDRNSTPLFISYYSNAFDPTPDRIHRHQYKVLYFSHARRDLGFLINRVNARIQQSDIEELEHIDPHRNWRDEDDFKVGMPWRLTNHQLRRSLALYAQRSGMVSLPSLRRQLQHLTDEMSRYYARGSLFATNFIGDDQDHFGLEWQDTAPLSAGLAYLRDMFSSTTTQFGGHVKWLEHRLKTHDSHLLMDRTTTLKRFKNGELSYKETPLGGCTKVGPCKDSGLRFIDVECLSGCENLVVKLPKLERVIAGQQALVSQLDPTTIEWRMESNDLNALLAARDRFLGQKNEG